MAGNCPGGYGKMSAGRTLGDDAPRSCGEQAGQTGKQANRM